MIRRLRPRARRGEEGSALVLALVFVTVIGLWVSAVLSFADTSFRTSRMVARQRGLVYAADGAMDAVIRKVQDAGQCRDIYSAPTTNGHAVKVDCQPPLKPNANNQFLNPSRALTIGDSLTADAVLPARGPATATIALDGYGPPAPTPPLVSAYLRVSHADDNVSVTATVFPNIADPTASTPPVSIPKHSDLREDRVAVPGLVNASLANARVVYTATKEPGADAVEALDGIWLDVTYGTGASAQTLTLKPTGHDQFDNPTNAYQIETASPQLATAALASSAATSASVVLSGYSRLTIPADSLIEQAMLRVAHGDDPDIASVTVRIDAADRTDGSRTAPVVLTADTTTACPPVSPGVHARLCLHPDVEEDDVDLLAKGLDDPAQFKALTVTYTVSLAPGLNKRGTDRLDGIWIELAYAPEGFPHALPDTKPDNAVLTLGDSPLEDGIHVTADTTLRNGARSNSTIRVDPGATLDVQGGRVVAAGGCTGITCEPGPEVAAPAYVPALDALPARATLPSRCDGGVVTLQPGYYDDAKALSNLTSGNGCTAKVVLLQSGAYYFDFAAGQSRGLGGKACLSDFPCTWRIDRDDVRVVGGEPKRWDPASSSPDPPFPGACDPNLGGVQLVFGGASRLELGGRAHMELCPVASTSTAKQRIAIYGLSTTLGAPPEQARLEPTAHDQFTDPQNALQIGGGTASARLASGGPASTSIELTGFTPLTLLPVDTVSKATLRLAHADLGDVDHIQVTLGDGTETFTVLSSQASPCALCLHSGLAEDRIDITSAVSAPGRLTNLRARLDVFRVASEAGKVATETLDGIAVEVSHGLPLVPPATAVLVPTGHNQFSPAANVVAGSPDGATASASSPASTKASITLSGFDQVAVPPDATIRSAVLHVRHQEPPGVTATITVGGGSPQTLPSRSTLTSDDVTVTAVPAGLRVTYEAALPPAATATLDSMSLDVTYVLAGDRPNVVQLQATAHNQFTNPANAFDIEATANARTAEAVLATGGAARAAMTLTGFGPALPAGDTVSQATLRVSHREVGDVAAVTTTVMPPSGPPIVVTSASTPCSLCTRLDLTEDRIPLALTSAAQLSGLTVRYEVQLLPGAARRAREVLDGIWLEVRHGNPAVTDVLKPSGHDQFTTPENALTADGAGATVAPAPVPSASIALSGYNQIALPDDAIIDGVALLVSHADGAGVGVTVTVAGITTSVDPATTMQTQRLELPVTAFDTAAKRANLSVRYDATVPPGSADVLDGVGIELRYRRGAMLEALTGCSVTPGSSPASCTVFTASSPASLAVHGTLFVPTAAVALSLDNVSNIVLERGLISRRAELGIRTVTPGRPSVIVPDDDLGPLTPRTRLFTAYVEEGGKVHEVVRATVRFDPGAATAADRIKVLSWSVLT